MILLECRGKHFSDPWIGFTRFTLLNETLPKGFLWSGEGLTKIHTTSRPDHLWPDAWTRFGKAAQRRDKQEWAIEKPKLEYARNLREFILLIRVMKSTKTSLKMQGES